MDEHGRKTAETARASKHADTCDWAETWAYGRRGLFQSEPRERPSETDEPSPV